MGVLIVDKPVGPSSFAVLRRVRSLVARSLAGPGGLSRRQLKCGHGGTLDPFASGVLPICIGEATKLAGFLLDADKAYEATVRFGVATDSADLTGAVVEHGPLDGLTESRLRDLVARFAGVIEQVPPMHSALKHQGRPLYAYAREGTEVVRAPRQVQIHEIEVLAFVPPDSLQLRLRCSKGTYVRVLAADLGRAAGTVAHLASLRRTASGPFRIEEAVTLADLEARLDARQPLPMVSLGRALAHLPGVTADGAAEAALVKGQRVSAAAVGLPEGMTGRVRVMREDQSLLAVAEVGVDGARPVRVFAPESLWGADSPREQL
jgi:tRNA pseudouridine55 synthase